MSQRVAGFTPETARQLLGIVRDGRSYGKQSVVYPQPTRGASKRPLASTYRGEASVPGSTDTDITWDHSSTTLLTGTADVLPVTTNLGQYIEAVEPGNYIISASFNVARTVQTQQYETYRVRFKLNGVFALWGQINGHLYAPSFSDARDTVSRTVALNLDAGDRIIVTVDSSAGIGIVSWLNLQYSKG
jgi:hypothetical protein